MSEGNEGREEFLAEAQEIIEGFSRNLLAIDAAYKKGQTEASLLNEAFRAIHTLKGLAGLFGVTELSSLTHRLEDLLDALRLGRVEVSAEVLDVLFNAVDVSHRLLSKPGEAGDALQPDVTQAVHGVLAAIEELGQAPPAGPAGYEIDPGILAVLTEYEEHRLQANLDSGLRLYRIRVQFDLMTIDKELEALKERARMLGEVITYLPTGGSSSVDVLELDLLLASGEDFSVLVGQLGGDSVVIEEVQRTPIGVSAPVPSRSPASVGMSRVPASEGDLDLEPTDRTSLTKDRRVTRRAVRVDIRKLDRLMNVVGELAILRSSLQTTAEAVRTQDRQLGGALHRMQRILERRLHDLQSGILEMRMVPLGQVFDRLARGVRQVSRDLGKEVRLVITGSDTEIDKLIVEELGDPLLHMLRNSIDHGIESEEERLKMKKGAVGTIALNAYQKGNHVMIEVEDDGRGIDEASLIARAVRLGAIEAEDADDLSREEALGLMFLPGLSTRDDVSETSGRGVGMDVVKTNIARIGGVIDVQSEKGIGTKLTLTLPITLAIVRALLVRVADHVFAIPLSSVSEVIAFDRKTRKVDDREVMTLRGSSLYLCRLAHLFTLESADMQGRTDAFVVVAQVGERRLGLVVDSIAGQQDIVIKALGPSLSEVRGFAGATELGDQRVGLVLDAAAIVEEVLVVGETLRKAVLNG